MQVDAIDPLIVHHHLMLVDQFAVHVALRCVGLAHVLPDNDFS